MREAACITRRDFARGLGLPVIYTCRKDMVDDESAALRYSAVRWILWSYSLSPNPPKERGDAGKAGNDGREGVTIQVWSQ